MVDQRSRIISSTLILRTNDLNIVKVIASKTRIKADKSFKFTLVFQTTNSRSSKQGAHFKNDSNAAKHLLFAHQDGKFVIVQSIVF